MILSGKWVAVACALALIVGTGTAAEWELSREGRTEYVIAQRTGASPAEDTAARELSTHLQQVTGAVFPVVAEEAIPSGSRAIFVGQTAYAAAQGIEFSGLDQQEWIIRTTAEGNVILSGGLLRGVLYSVFQFLENQAGCYWLDEHNAVIPRQANLRVSDLDRKGKPFFRIRQIFDTLDAQLDTVRFKTRNLGQGYSWRWGAMEWAASPLVGRPDQHHTFFSYSQNFPSDRPELFSLDRKGRRLVAASSEGPGQICLTHPEVRKLVVAQLRNFVALDRQEATEKNYPPPVIYDLSANDNQNPCQCPDCSALAEREDSAAGPVLDFVNAVAAEIEPEYPDIFIRTFAYLFSLQPPKIMRARPNVIVQLAQMGWELKGGNRDTLTKLDHPSNREAREILRAWSGTAENLAVWDYWILFKHELTFPAPSHNLAGLTADIALYAKSGVKDVFVECENPYSVSFFALRRFVGFQLLDDPHQSADALIELFLRGYYGPAQGTMKRLLDLLSQQQDAYGKALGRVAPADRDYLDREFFENAFRLLDQAEGEAAGNPQLVANIRRERVPLLTGLLWRWDRLTEHEGLNRDDRVRQLQAEFRAAVSYYLPGETAKADREVLEAKLARFTETGSVERTP